jgi:hypothetical protein
MMVWWAALGPEYQLKAVALFGASIAFIVGLLQYRKTQSWKRAEWVAEEMTGFFGDPKVRAALCMIDWGARRVQLYPERKTVEEQFVVVTDDRLAKALEDHQSRPNGFTEDEVTMRDTFDHFLDRLERIQSFVEAGLVKTSDVAPYLRYWAVDIMEARPGDSSVDRLVQLRNYIRRYRFTGVDTLLRSVASARTPSRKKNDPASPPMQPTGSADG